MLHHRLHATSSPTHPRRVHDGDVPQYRRGELGSFELGQEVASEGRQAAEGLIALHHQSVAGNLPTVGVLALGGVHDGSEPVRGGLW